MGGGGGICSAQLNEGQFSDAVAIFFIKNDHKS
jgi:hypothetical protein